MTSKSPAPPRIGNGIAAGAAWMVGRRMLDRAERHILATLEGIFTARQLRASS